MDAKVLATLNGPRRFTSNGTEVYDGNLIDEQDPTIATATSYENASLIADALEYADRQGVIRGI
jgi:hypothetical protein